MSGLQFVTSAKKWIDSRFSNVSLDAIGLIALADFSTISERTAIVGASSWLDPLILCPGLHRQQHAAELNRAEYPAVGALTTGYVFRVENEATVLFLQKIGITGHLTNVRVSKDSTPKSTGIWVKLSTSSLMAHFFYILPILLTASTLSTLVLYGDRWGTSVVLMLIWARICNSIVIHRRSRPGWKGKPEPGVRGDLLILLSQDRWVRMTGLVDDLKMVTSGEWLRSMDFVESSVVGFAAALVYVAAALAANASQAGKLLFALQLLVSGTCLAISNHLNASSSMHGCVLEKMGVPKKYERRQTLADELIEETGREDWAIRLGMIVPKTSTETSTKGELFKEQVTM